MKTIIFDTNAVLRYLLDDVHHQHIEAKMLVGKARAGEFQIYIPEVVVFEVFYSMRSKYGYKKDSLVVMIKTLLTSDYLRIENETDFAGALKIYIDSTLEFIDCFILTKSRNLNFELFTFDKKLNKYYAKNS